jgi:uncharacterized YigZ family protein
LHPQHFSYRTIAGPSEGEYKEKGSRFLGFVFPVSSEEEVKDHLASLRKKYYDARHHCFAWMLGADHKHFRSFDDGEPNHSAGDPILGQIRSKNLTNVLVVVVRYFGGVKLGVGGLISAYRTAAEEALNKADIVEREVTERMRIIYDYTATPEVMRLTREFNLQILSRKFDAECELQVAYGLIDKARLLEKLALLIATGSAIRYSSEAKQ